MLKHIHIFITFIAMIACQTVNQNKNIPEVFISGTQKQFDAFTLDLLNGKKEVEREWLLTMQDFPSRLQFRISEEDGGIWYGGVEKLSEYFICILETKTGIGSMDILKAKYSRYNEKCIKIEKCGACFTETYPIDAEARGILIKYWYDYLATKGKAQAIKKMESEKGEAH